jgi:hypothetical protein
VVDRETAVQRARQVEMRLRLAVPLEGDQWHRIRRACEEAKELEPADRLAALLDLAEGLRPALSPKVVEHTLPSSGEWR